MDGEGHVDGRRRPSQHLEHAEGVESLYESEATQGARTHPGVACAVSHTWRPWSHGDLEVPLQLSPTLCTLNGFEH
jgi:hypothetical protein